MVTASGTSEHLFSVSVPPQLRLFSHGRHHHEVSLETSPSPSSVLKSRFISSSLFFPNPFFTYFLHNHGGRCGRAAGSSGFTIPVSRVSHFHSSDCFSGHLQCELPRAGTKYAHPGTMLLTVDQDVFLFGTVRSFVLPNGERSLGI